MSDAMPEIVWKTHPTHRYYQASSDGRVRSLDRFVRQGNHIPGVEFDVLRKGRELKQFLIGPKRRQSIALGQYLGFDLAPGGGIKKRKMGVHRFVCETFHGLAPSPLHQVRHLNGNPQDNRVENLRWGTCTDNARDRVRHGRQHRGGSRKSVAANA